MITIWDQKKPWESKVNFIQDDPMVFLGYDMKQNCCERYGWYLEGDPFRDTDGNLPFHTFDTSRQPEDAVIDYKPDNQYDTPSGIRFFLKGELEHTYKNGVWSKKRHPDASIVLWNCHNGYYYHGWQLLGVTKENEL